MAKSDWHFKDGWMKGPTISYVKASSPQKMPKCHKDFRRVTIHSEGVDRDCTPGHVKNLAKYTIGSANLYYHFVFCDRCDEIAQIIKPGYSARSMKGGAVCSAGNSANRHGKFNIQICLAARGNKKTKPFDQWPPNVKAFLRALSEDKKIPPKALDFKKQIRSKDKWCNTEKGWAMHAHGPMDDHNDCVPQQWSFKKFKKDILGLG